MRSYGQRLQCWSALSGLGHTAVQSGTDDRAADGKRRKDNGKVIRGDCESIADAAAECGVSISALNNIENDVTDPKLSTLVVIARALKVYVNQLFTVEKL